MVASKLIAGEQGQDFSLEERKTWLLGRRQPLTPI
jgi:hypothetical protein